MALARAGSAFVRTAARWLIFGVFCSIAAAPAEAQVKRSLSGSNLRFQIGAERQIPIAATQLVHTAFSMSATAMIPNSCLPKGGIKGVHPTPMAEATTWPTGRFRILTSRFTLRGPFSNRGPGGGKYSAKVIGARTRASTFQVQTDFQVQWPKPSMTMTPPRGLYVHPTAAGPAKARKNGGMSGRSVESTSTASTLSLSHFKYFVSSKENGVYPPRYSPSFSPLMVTVAAVITPAKSTKTRRLRSSSGARKCRR